MPVWERKKLKYPTACLEESDIRTGKEMVGLGMKYIRKRSRRGEVRRHYYRVALCNSNLEVIYEEQFDANESREA